VSAVDQNLHPDHLRTRLTSFWGEALEIEPSEKGVIMALPQTGADGWQVVIQIQEVTPGRARITDEGRVLGGLLAAGQNIESPATAQHIKRVVNEHRLEREGLEIVRYLPLPLDPLEVHVTAEGVAALSHLHVLHEPVVRGADVADKTLRQIFSDRGIEAQAGAKLDGRTEKGVKVDYYVQAVRPVAFEIIRRRGRLFPVMEQWGYRWQDLRKTNQHLMPVMLWDPAMQDMDDASRAIGEEVCDLFCPYDETDRVHELLEAATRYAVGEE